MNSQSKLFPSQGRVIGFARKEFKAKQNFTVRLGGDWAPKRDICVGDHVTIASQDRDEMYFIAKITHLIICDLINIPKSVIKDNHQNDCRDGIGLVLALQEYYKKTLIASDRVTCVGFEPVHSLEKPIKTRQASYDSTPVLSVEDTVLPVNPYFPTGSIPMGYEN